MLHYNDSVSSFWFSLISPCLKAGLYARSGKALLAEWDEPSCFRGLLAQPPGPVPAAVSSCANCRARNPGNNQARSEVFPGYASRKGGKRGGSSDLRPAVSPANGPQHYRTAEFGWPKSGKSFLPGTGLAFPSGKTRTEGFAAVETLAGCVVAS